MTFAGHLTRTAALALCLVVAALGASADASPGDVTAFNVPGCFLSAEGLAPAAGEGVLLRLCAKKGQTMSRTLGHLLPSGELVLQRIPKSEPGPILVGPAREIWQAARSEQSPAAKDAELSVDRIAPDDSVKTFPVGTAEEPFDELRIDGMVPDGAGAIWLAIGDLRPTYYLAPGDTGGGELVRVQADGAVARFTVPSEVEPQDLVRGPDGNLWFTGVRGRGTGERTFTPGSGYVGRMTPSGEFTLFPTETEGSEPEGIAVGPDDRLWFSETATGVREVATIGTDGTFGPSFKLPYGVPQEEITFGPEGDAWLSGIQHGLLRLTPRGQETVYPHVRGAVVTGREGDIWSLESTKVWRVVPGAPGIDITDITVSRPSRTVSVDLACGGSSSGCAGALDLELRNRLEDPRKPATEGSRFRFLETTYSVEPESQATLTLPIPAKTFALGRRELPKRWGDRSTLRVLARATVEGGPKFERKLRASVGGEGHAPAGEALDEEVAGVDDRRRQGAPPLSSLRRSVR
jgi:streptogramin lyase